jgi:hypothetical protein
MFAFLNTPLFQLLHHTMAGFLDLSPKSIKNLTDLAKTCPTHISSQGCQKIHTNKMALKSNPNVK